MNKPLKMNEKAEDYPGVIASGKAMRLIVSARGGSYRLQEPDGDGWRDFATFSTGGHARSWCALVGVDVPSSIMDAADNLSDCPADCPQVPIRPASAVLRLHARPSVRRGTVPRWDVFNDAGALLCAASAHPLHDGAAALVALGCDPDRRVTLRHEGAGHDAFRPLLLRVAAAAAAKRKAEAERLAGLAGREAA